MAIYSEFSHQKWWLSIVMLVYQRVQYTYTIICMSPFSCTKISRFLSAKPMFNDQTLIFLGEIFLLCLPKVPPCPTGIGPCLEQLRSCAASALGSASTKGSRSPRRSMMSHGAVRTTTGERASVSAWIWGVSLWRLGPVPKSRDEDDEDWAVTP